MGDNIIKVTFSDTCKFPWAHGLWQYDYGQKLEVYGLDLPATVEVGFSVNNCASILGVGEFSDGVMHVDIPDEILELSGRLRIHIRYVTEEYGQTENLILGEVYARPKPSENAIGNKEKEDLFTRTIAEVNKSADRAESAMHKSEEIYEKIVETGTSGVTMDEVKEYVDEKVDNTVGNIDVILKTI